MRLAQTLNTSLNRGGKKMRTSYALDKHESLFICKIKQLNLKNISLQLKWYINHITSVILHHQFIICADLLVLNIKFNKYNNLNYTLKTNNLDQRELQEHKNEPERKTERKFVVFLLISHIRFFCCCLHVLSFDRHYEFSSCPDYYMP